ncbi:MAG: hypothetical protein AB7C97_09825 [Oscillospiraceae bacterium]
MENEDNGLDLSADIGQTRNILEEIKKLNREMADPKNEIFKKSTYWHQQSSVIDNSQTVTLLENIAGQLTGIENKLTEIKDLLVK